MLRPYLILATIATVAACASRTVRLPPLPPREVAAVGGGADEVQALVRLALTLDAAGDRRADTLYTADAVVVGNARIRLGAPRFAGISNGGGTGRGNHCGGVRDGRRRDGLGASGLPMGQAGRAARGGRPGDIHL